jgi:hypothetical protein
MLATWGGSVHSGPQRARQGSPRNGKHREGLVPPPAIHVCFQGVRATPLISRNPLQPNDCDKEHGSLLGAPPRCRRPAANCFVSGALMWALLGFAFAAICLERNARQLNLVPTRLRPRLAADICGGRCHPSRATRCATASCL